jgi:hypothetical protein
MFREKVIERKRTKNKGGMIEKERKAKKYFVFS